MGAAVDFLNDAELNDIISDVAKTVPTVNKIVADGNFGGSEDYSIMGRRVQTHGGKAAFFICGADRTAGHHQGKFDIDETGLTTAFDMYKGIVEKTNK